MTSVGLEARQIAADVRQGRRTPREVVAEHLAHIERHEPRIGAFQLVRADRALSEADELAGRADIASLPLAGVPVGIKDLVEVAGEPMRYGSTATSEEPRDTDGIHVQRLRAAGAIVVGLTTLPELAVFGATTSRFGTTRNPWNLDYTTAGSSGGSAASVAAGMVPIALGSDGLGSIRLPSAAAGIVGLKPGRGVVPQTFAGSWFGMSQFGPMGRTVGDIALMLDVLADDHGRYADVAPPTTPIRAAVSTAVPLRPGSISRKWKQAATDAAEILRGAGHIVADASPRYPASLPLSVLARWSQGTLECAEIEGIDLDELEPRIRTIARLGERWRARRPVASDAADSWHDTLDAFLREHHLLLTPTMARRPLRAEPWHERSFVANLVGNAPRYPMTGPFNLADVPAASVPMGRDRAGVPVAVQVVGRRGHEADVLAVAALLERERPGDRIAPGFAPS